MATYREADSIEERGDVAQRSRRSLIRGILVFRWVWLGWMMFLAATLTEDLASLPIAWLSLGAAAIWTVWLSVSRQRPGSEVLLIDFALCAWLVLASGLVIEDGRVVSGRPFFATGYPLSAPLLWGAIGGPWRGLLAGATLGVAHLLTRPLNGVPLSELNQSQVQNVLGAAMNYIVAGVAIGLVARFLTRSEEAVQVATDELVQERERAARLAAREKLGRQIHDSVLQTLALVHKRGRELARSRSVDAAEVERLADLAGRQERELRALILREEEEPPGGAASLRDALEEEAQRVTEVSVSVSAVGPIYLASDRVTEAVAAVRQALENVNQHADATRATIFAEDHDGRVTISVRDDGRGFIYDEEDLRARRKAGILKSMKGRIEDLGGSISVKSAPGRGTEVEFSFPRQAP